MGRANLHADRCCIYPPVFSGKSDRIFCKSASFLQRKSCCNATVFPSYVGAPAVFLSSVSFYSEIFRRLEFSTLWVTLKSCLEWRSENRRILILLQKKKFWLMIQHLKYFCWSTQTFWHCKTRLLPPKGSLLLFSQMPPSPPYRAPCTWQTCTMAQLPQLHARCTNPLQQCFPPQLPISHGSVFRQAAVFRVNHPTLVVAARTRGGKSVHWSWSRIGGEAAPSTISCCPRGGDGGCNCCSVVCAVTAT